jgi:protein-disulfide isomerase
VSDEPQSDTDSGDEAPPERDGPGGQPVWMALLTPVAIIIGAAIVAGAILYTDNDGSGETVQVAANGDVTSTGVTEPAEARPNTMLSALLDYADQLSLDVDAFEQCLGDGERGEIINQHLALGNQLGVTGTPTFFINDKMVVGAQPTAVFIEVIERELEGPPSSIEDYSQTIQELAATDPPRFRVIDEPLDVSGAEIHGNPDAPVMVAEFSDFQCPFCQRWVEQSMEPIRDMLGEDVAFAFMHFPLTQIHANAGFASFGAICAGEQDSFWEMHDLLFERQQQWANLPPN